MNIAGFVEETIVDGTGLRSTLYVSGCTHNCFNCHNPETHNFHYGKDYFEEIDNIMEKIRKTYDILDGITISGGDPLHPNNLSCVYDFIFRIKEEFPKLNIWIYTGYTIEELEQRQDKLTMKILQNSDVLVDGMFIEHLKDPDLSFKGSSNQRIIDLNKTFKNNKIELLELDT